MSLTAAGAAFTPRWIAAQPLLAAAQDDPGTVPVKSVKLADNLYLLQGVGGNMALQTGPDGLLLIDASYAAAVPRIREAIASLAPASAAPSLLINTHWHGDHTGGNEGLHAAGFSILAHRQTRDRLSHTQEMKLFHRTVPPSPASALPTQVFDSTLTLYRNSDTLNLAHFAPAHTDSDISIHFTQSNVLHLGDVWFNGMYPFIDEGTGGNIDGMISGSKQALSLADSATKIIPGHGPLGAKSDLAAYHEMLSTVRDKVAAFKKQGLSEQETAAKKPTAEFDAQWGKGFMSADVFTGIVYRTV
jgi:glyoxylase-like metal-dependent hydrolase (beta-lactamase superfamily II)